MSISLCTKLLVHIDVYLLYHYCWVHSIILVEGSSIIFFRKILYGSIQLYEILNGSMVSNFLRMVALRFALLHVVTKVWFFHYFMHLSNQTHFSSWQANRWYFNHVFTTYELISPTRNQMAPLSWLLITFWLINIWLTSNQWQSIFGQSPSNIQ